MVEVGNTMGPKRLQQTGPMDDLEDFGWLNNQMFHLVVHREFLHSQDHWKNLKASDIRTINSQRT